MALKRIELVLYLHLDPSQEWPTESQQIEQAIKSGADDHVRIADATVEQAHLDGWLDLTPYGHWAKDEKTVADYLKDVEAKS